ncbi:protein MCM10 homolog [Ornithorhynchus anatinus]|uniref:Protein MCM10 homolog n=1 Tax=Ornithorhynchus anatinus TaxID=9258 RepID=F6QTL1_ORNAN|nr:protein MCM10 homolog [Ornithorhynchus anatinus]
MDGEEDDLALLAALLEENEDGGPGGPGVGQPDDYDELFDAEDDGEAYVEEEPVEEEPVEEEKENRREDVATLFGDVGDLSEDEEGAEEPKSLPGPAPQKSNEDLQEELRKLQKQMKMLQEQLKMTTISKSASPPPPPRKPLTGYVVADAGRSAPAPLREKKIQNLRESDTFSTELDVPALPKSKRLAPAAQRKPPVAPAPSGPAQPLRSVPGNKTNWTPGHRSAGPPGKSPGKNSQAVPVEAFSGLRLRRPRVSSEEMCRKMAGRKLIRLPQLRDKLASGNLDQMDWVTFGVILNKVTPQSASSGKTFSIWSLNDLHNLDKSVSLFLFGEVHREHWKTDKGTVIGLLNANPMKPKEGSDEVCLTVDHAQKILIVGEALDLGTCRAKKKNGEPCTQTVNLSDCEFCQYHVQSQYRKLSAKRADLQSSFSGGRVPKKMARRGAGLKERLCQDGFYYGGVSSASYAASVAAAAAPKKKTQTTLTHLVVKGSRAVVQETREKLGLPRKTLACSDEFKELMDLPTFGARNLKQHLAKAKVPGTTAPIRSISASALLKQQKQQMLEMRKKRSEERQERFLQSSAEGQNRPPGPSPDRPPLRSPPPWTENPEEARKASPPIPKLGRGFSKGDDVLLFDDSPRPRPKLSASAEAKKLAAITKLRAKGQILPKSDPNGVKRKERDPGQVLEVAERAEINAVTSSPPGEDDLEPSQKRRREQLAYLESEEFQTILKARSKHTGVLKQAEAELQERYFEPLVKKEQMEEKMRNTKEVKCRVVTCKTCSYTHLKPLDTCVSENHNYQWHDGLKRFFKCPCGNRSVSLDRLPKKHCSNCGLFKWERDGMLKEKSGPKIGAETLLPRGEEHPRFLNSLQ